MADSKREAIMKQIATTLASAAGINGRVFRSNADGIPLEDHPCIQLKWTTEQANPNIVTFAERTLSVEVDVLTRGDAPDTLADPIAQSAHALLMANAQLNGLAVDTQLGTASFEYTSADQTAGKLTHEYMVMFRHNYGDMTT